MLALRKITLIVFAVMAGNMALAQNKINGTAKDSLGEPLPFATVILLQANDSIMYQFSTTNETGAFELKAIQNGDYVLQMSFTGYQTLYKNINVNGGDVNLGTVTMKAKDITLDEFAVEEERVPIKVKEDTIEYNADAFATQPNAKVEDLLKQLPGVEVDKDGSVKAQGETVTKVLVEGKEFFGDDPKVATKNLPADAIDKVQVFDKMSDMAEFSGVDDGDRTKTINLQLKEGKKKGYFGYFTGGYGTEDRYESKFNLNRFGKKTQMSAIGMSNNINEQGFSFDDYVSFMGGMGNMMRGGRKSFNEAGVPLGSDLSSGLVNTTAGGINLNTEFSKKTTLQSSYFYTHIGNDLVRGVDRTNFIGERAFDSYDSTVQETASDLHRINLRLRHKIDSTSDFTLKGNAKYNMGRSASYAEQYTYSTENILQNSAITDNSADGTGLSFSTAGTYRKKFAKKGRTFTSEASIGMNNDDQEGNLNSLNSFFVDSLSTWRSDTNHQNQYLINDRLNYSVKLDYTEPVGKGKYLQFNYSYGNNNYDYNKDFYDVADQVEVFNSTLSNQYTNAYNYHRGGAKIMFNKKKSNLTFGANVQASELDGSLMTSGTKINQSFFNILPNLKYVKRFTSSKRLSINYRTSMNEPSIEQLNPVVDNTDPFDISVGNPDLKPEYRHRFNMHVMSFNQFSFTNFFMGVFGTYTSNKIRSQVTIDANSLVQTTTPINTDYNVNVSNYMNFSTPLRFMKAKININGNIGFNRGLVFVNAIENTSDQWTTSVDVRLENRKKDVVDISVGTDIGNNLTTYSVSSSLDQQFMTIDYYADFMLYVGKKLSIGSSFDYTVYSGEAFAENTQIPILKADISYYCLKDNKGQLKFHIFDVLNQNQGINRTTNLNYIEEERVNTLQRYFLLSFTYSMSGFGGKPGSQGKSGGFWHGKGGRRK